MPATWNRIVHGFSKSKGFVGAREGLPVQRTDAA